MKKVLLIMILVSLVGCSNYFYKIETDCKISDEKLLKNLTSKLLSENYSITNSNIDIGLLVATSNTKHYSVMTEYYIWTFQSNNGKLVANCKLYFSAMNRTDSKYLNDNTEIRHTDYWNIRNFLELQCSKLVITEIKQ